MTVEAPRISINSKIKANEPRPFLGRITLDELRPGKYENKPWQWCFAVKPLKFVVKNLGFPSYVGISPAEIENGPKEQSQFGLHMNAFQEVFEGEDFEIGQGQLVDRFAWWVKKTHFYPANADGTQFKTELLIPVKAATDEEIEEAGGEPPVPTSVTLSAEDAERVLVTLEGKTRSQFPKAALRGKLDPSLTQQIVSGVAVDYLIENGLASFGEDDTLVRA